MKFHNVADKVLFLKEIGEAVDFIKLSGDFKPSHDQIEKLKIIRENTEELKYSNCKRGLSRFLNSTKSKVFHRVLAENLTKENLSIADCMELAKAMSSLKTHLIIETDYYHSKMEAAQLWDVLNNVVETFPKIEKNAIKSKNISEEHKGYLLSLIESSALISSLAKKSGKTESEVDSIWSETKDEMISTGEKENSNFYAVLVSIVKKKLGI